MEGEKADYFRRELDIIIGKIGPQMYAFETLQNAANTYQEAHNKYQALQQEWQQGRPISQGIIAALRREVAGSKETLLRVERDFKDSKGKKTPAYKEALQETEELSIRLRRLHQNISFGQLSMAETKLRTLKAQVEELKKDKKYFTEENAVQEISRLEQAIQTLLDNVEESEFITEEYVESVKKGTETVLSDWTPLKEKIEQASKLNGIELAEYYFNEQAFDLAEKHFKETKDERAKLYLSAIKLERRKESEKILVRGRISQNHLEDYKKLTSMLEQEDTGQTPRYIMENIRPMLEKFSEIPELYFLAREAEDRIDKLSETAQGIDPANKEYKTRIKEFIEAVKKTQEFDELQRALNAYLLFGQKEQKPVILSLLATTYEELGRKKDARKNYESLIESSTASEEDKNFAREKIEKLNR